MDDSTIEKFTAGTALTDISPPKGIALAGYPHYPRYNKGVHDPLHAGCLYLSDGKSKIMIIAADLTLLCKAYADTTRKEISRATDIPFENIFLCVSHTHSAPNTAPSFDEGIYPDEKYIKEITEKIVQAAKEAVQSSFPAKIGAGKALCGKEKGVGGNRRDPGGITDPEALLVAVKDKGGTPRACFVSYALHPSVLHHDSPLVSADYPGYIRTCLKNEYPGMNFLFAQGASGNQSTRYFRDGQTFEEAERIGTALGKEIAEALKTVEYQENPVLSLAEDTLDILLRDIPSTKNLDQQIEEARKDFGKKKDAGAGYIELQNADLKILGFEDLRVWAELKEKGEPLVFCDPEKPLGIKAVRIGTSICLFFTQTEMFVEYQLEMKKRSPFEYLLLATLVNGASPGYICTPETYEEGGYESGASLYKPEMGAYFLKKATGLMEKLK